MQRINIDITAAYAIYQELQSIRLTADRLTELGTPIHPATLSRKFKAAGLKVESVRNGKRGKRKSGQPPLSNAEKQRRHREKKKSAES